MSIQAPLSTSAQPGDLAHLIGEKDRDFIIKLEPGEKLETHLGILYHDDLIGKVWGARVKSHKDKTFLLLQPALDDLLRNINRETQIMYPKDIGYILVSMGIGPGKQVIEAGTGSGAFTTALAYLVGPTGKVYSYEQRPKFSHIAQANLDKFGLQDRVIFKQKDIAEGFDEDNIPALFLDVPDPHNYIPQVRAALGPGGFFGSLLPTTNQVSDLVTALKKHGFDRIEISEIMHRYYKPSATRLRPVDRMVAHTGYLAFARRMTARAEEPSD